MMVESSSNSEKVSENETCAKAKSVGSWAYREDANFKFRASMEDGHVCSDNFNGDLDQGLFCLFDGHGGPEAVEYCKLQFCRNFQRELEQSPDNIEQALENCFKKIDDQLKLNGAIASGTTATIIFIRKEEDRKVVYCANVGDSKSYLISQSEVIKLSYDDKVSDEKEVKRIKDQGGFIFRGRVAGQLAITRALGDHQLKEEGVTGTPHITRRELSPSDRFIISASDGLWDVLLENEILEQIQQNRADKLAEDLLKFAIVKESRDNISIIVIDINNEINQSQLY